MLKSSLFFNFFSHTLYFVLTDIEVSENEASEILEFAIKTSALERPSGSSNTSVVDGMC